MIHKMTGFYIIIIFALGFVFFSCEGKITSPPNGTRYTILPGGNKNITWSFDDDISKEVISREWLFTHTDNLQTKILGTIFLNSHPEMRPGILPGISITKPATLVLNNVNQSYDGTYRFTLIPSPPDNHTSSSVRVFIAKKPNVTLNCSTVTLNEGDDFISECKGLGGNPPANVTWYKDGNQTQSKTRTEEQLLTLVNVDETDSGTYKCVAESYPDPLYRDEKSIKINVRFGPKNTSIELNPNPAPLGQSLTITCSSRGFPEPSYKISHNGTHLINTTESYTVNNVTWSDAGEYECNASNGVGTEKASKVLNVIDSVADKSDDGGLGVGAIVGIIIAVLVALGIFIFLAWYFKLKEKCRKWCGNSNGNSRNATHDDMDETSF